MGMHSGAGNQNLYEVHPHLRAGRGMDSGANTQSGVSNADSHSQVENQYPTNQNQNRENPEPSPSASSHAWL